MIDTDKYEGHTPAPWDGILSGHFTWLAIEQLPTVDKTLMQDAPLLLQEVKRLRLDLASGRITTIVNPNDDHNRTLYVTIEFPDGEVYRGYVEKEGEEE